MRNTILIIVSLALVVAANLFQDPAGAYGTIGNYNGTTNPRPQIKEDGTGSTVGQVTWTNGTSTGSTHEDTAGKRYLGKKRWLGYYNVSRYYTPVRNQLRYYVCDTVETAKYPEDCYQQDYVVNCGGDCLITADGTNLKTKDPHSVIACPKTIALGSRLWISDIGYVTCNDRGGAIKGKRLDLWAGIGDEGLNNILSDSRRAGKKEVILLL